MEVRRQNALTAEERSEIARRAGEARWKKDGHKPMPRASHSGPLRISDIEFDCAIVKEGDRICGWYRRRSSWTRWACIAAAALSTRRARNEAGAQTPLFLAYKNLKPFADKHLGGVRLRAVQIHYPIGECGTRHCR